MAVESKALSLGTCLDRDQVEEMSERFLAAVAGGGRIVLDGSELKQIDGAGMQLLLALVRAADEEGTGIEWRNPARCLLDTAERMGLKGDLRLEEGQ